MGKRNKSKRFIEQGKGAVKKHDEKFPYRMTFAESEARANNEASFEG
ncbi:MULTISPECIES: competence protein [Aeribacillus]|uniref:Competence protein n=1 Tax=Aeribacillus pallidus TaxID=33936 RepID=A0A223E5K7_9BACI|nr:competence protein [Aeribacillus pallidus]ASS90509.1 competence protein [Aeribacillus pallidus]